MKSSGQVFIVPYSVDDSAFMADRPVRWEGGTFCGEYDLHPDGSRLLVRQAVDRPDQVILFENFIEYLQKQIPRLDN